MNTKSHFLLYIPLSVLLIALMSCESGKTPDRVSEHFWLGVETKNLGLVKKYSLVNSINEVEDLTQFENIKDVTFGKIIIDGANAEIETVVTTLLDDKKVDIHLSTYLEKHNETWKVDFRKTILPLNVNQNMAEVFGDIEEMTEEITKQIEESVEEIKEKVVPEIKSELEQAEKEIREKLPELKDMFQDFLHELEKSIEDIIKEPEKDAPKTHET